MEQLDHKKISLALKHVNSEDFEQFTLAFWKAKVGERFVPLGGVHDGGADGIIYPTDQKTGEAKYVQASTQKDFRTKIRESVNTLRKKRNDFSNLIYCTNQQISSVDLREIELSKELDCSIQIIEHRNLLLQINDSEKTINAFNSYVLPHIISLFYSIGASNTIPKSEFLPDISLCVFLNQELSRKQDKYELLESLTDSLIFWALRNTNPDKNIFMSRNEIAEEVLTAVPSAAQFLYGVLDDRLTELRKKKWKHAKSKLY